MWRHECRVTAAQHMASNQNWPQQPAGTLQAGVAGNWESWWHGLQQDCQNKERWSTLWKSQSRWGRMYSSNWFYGWPRSTSSGIMGLGTMWTSDGLYRQIHYSTATRHSTAVRTRTCGLVFMLFLHTVITMPVQHTFMWLYVLDIYIDSCNEYQYLWLYTVKLIKSANHKSDLMWNTYSHPNWGSTPIFAQRDWGKL